MNLLTRRSFLQQSSLATAGLAGLGGHPLLAQERGARPPQASGVTVLNPRGRVPLSIIIDDSTCLVNLNKFAIPQFAQVRGGAYEQYNWREWPDEIPDAFVRRFGEWAADSGVKGKYSIVPFPACVGRLDRTLPGWTQKELDASIALVRELMVPNWDIHPEMVTHTRVIDTKTGHPYPEFSLRYMENWDWATGKSADQIADYVSYGLNILKNIGLPCSGVTTPGGFGSKARPALAQAVGEACRSVFQTEIPHYFRDLYDSGSSSVAPRVELARDLDSEDPRCVVSIVGCTGDWTGGWDNTLPAGADRFLSADGQSGRLPEVIRRGEPAILVCHWTGIYFNGRELGFQIFQEVARRLKSHFASQTRWMRLDEIARYWAARELTRIEFTPNSGAVRFKAPYACPEFTVAVSADVRSEPVMRVGPKTVALRESPSLSQLEPGKFFRAPGRFIACVDLPKGASELVFA